MTTTTKPSQVLRYAADGASIMEMLLRLEPLANNAIKPWIIEMTTAIMATSATASRQNAAIRESLLQLAIRFESNNL